MKLLRVTETAKVTIPKAAIAISKLDGSDNLELHALESAAVLLKDRMTAMEVVNAIDSLDELAGQLIEALIEACEQCVCCEENCPFTSENRGIKLPSHLLDEANIPEGAKLSAVADPETGCVIVSNINAEHDIDPDMLRESCWDSRNILWYAHDGFGCDPHAIGRSIRCTCLGDGEQTRWNRGDFIGVLDERFLPDWAVDALSELRGQKMRLSEQDISFAEDISEVGNLLNFYMETNFDVDAVFGTNVCTPENDDWLNAYANYDMESGQLCGELEIALHRGDGSEEMLTYPLSTAEKEILLRKMDDYCRQQTGQSLAEYSAQMMAEEFDGPVMQ